MLRCIKLFKIKIEMKNQILIFDVIVKTLKIIHFVIVTKSRISWLFSKDSQKFSLVSMSAEVVILYSIIIQSKLSV